ncbi:MAG: hypothetical protein KF709_05050 [Gemmatimonadaceae bacterium]|nr:hypothetical protein [Gemmatimonadaceae bacterium]
MTRVSLALLATVFATSLSACGDSKPAASTPRTPEQQRAVDSTIGASGLPGSRGVQNALSAADSAAARQRRLDSIANAP